jgi:hypothetical protein
MEAIQEILAYVDAYATANLEQFAGFHRPLAKLMEEHDKHVEELRLACSTLQATLESLDECREIFKIVTAGGLPDPDMSTTSWFSIVEETQRLPFVVQHVVNNIQAVPRHYPMFDFWEVSGADFLALLKSPKVLPAANNVKVAAQSLLRVSQTLHERLEETRDRLSIEAGVPPAPPISPGDDSPGTWTYAQRTAPARTASVLREKAVTGGLDRCRSLRTRGHCTTF